MKKANKKVYSDCIKLILFDFWQFMRYTGYQFDNALPSTFPSHFKELPLQKYHLIDLSCFILLETANETVTSFFLLSNSSLTFRKTSASSSLQAAVVHLFKSSKFRGENSFEVFAYFSNND